MKKSLLVFDDNTSKCVKFCEYMEKFINKENIKILPNIIFYDDYKIVFKLKDEQYIEAEYDFVLNYEKIDN